MNDAREIVGFYTLADGSAHGFMLSKGSFVTIDIPGAVQILLNRNNDAGTIVDDYQDGTSGVTHGFVRRHGQVSIVDGPGSSFTRLRGINERGTIVGWFADSNGNLHGLEAKRTDD